MVRIIETSMEKDFTARERIKIKDFNNSIAITEGTLIENPVGWAILEITSDAEPFYSYVIVTEDGTIYRTSAVCFQSFKSIFDELGIEEKYTIKVTAVQSKKYKGKTFYVCSLV